MQILIVFRKSDKKVIATFKLNTMVTNMDCLLIPEGSYLMTTEKDILQIGTDGDLYVKGI